MIIFEDDELEIALCTFNRPDFLEKLLSKVYYECQCRNITFRVVDASTNNDSESIVRDFNSNFGNNNPVMYTRVNSDTLPGFMQIEAIRTSDSKYVWVYADSRDVDFAEFDKAVFPLCKSGFDILVFFGDNFKIPVGRYDDISLFAHECFVPFTCTGCSIYRRQIFLDLFSKSWLYEKCDQIYANNYAFAWMGYAFSALALCEKPRAYFVEVKMHSVKKKKKITWVKRFYECWIDNLLSITENLPDKIDNKELIPSEVWDKLKLDSHSHCYIGRIKGDMDRNKYSMYLKNGKLENVGANIKRIRFYACAPILLVYVRYAISESKHVLIHLFKRF